MMRKPALVIALLPTLAFGTLAPLSASAQSAEQYQSVLSALYPADEPGAAALVARDGEVVFLGASGVASLELGVPLAPDMVFEIGSITKQFTAAAIMMLLEEGKLALDDPITKLLPDYPAYGENITVEHLLTHTSGVVSYTGIPGYMASEARKDVSVEELIDVFKDLPVEFEPGERYAYSNSGYILLGAIIEKASGMPYAEFIQERIFDRLGMNDSYYGSHSRIIPRRASGYSLEGDTYTNASFLSMSQPYAAGALMTTVEDLLRWNQALFGGQVVSDESLERMTTSYTLNNGNSTGYGYGLAVGDVRGQAAIRHGGGIFGYVTDAIYLPEQKVFVAAFSNNTGKNVSMAGSKLAALAIGDPYPEFEEIALDEEILERYVGVYQIDEEAQRIVTVEDGQLYTQRTGGQRVEAFPASETHFFYKHSLSHFEFVLEDGEVTGMLMYQGGSKEAEEAVKVSDEVPVREAIDLDPAIYDDYVGVYELGPGFELTVTREDEVLMAQATGQGKAQLFPESETEFFIREIDAQITFIRGAAGTVDELILHQGGRDMPAVRKR